MLRASHRRTTSPRRLPRCPKEPSIPYQVRQCRGTKGRRNNRAPEAGAEGVGSRLGEDSRFGWECIFQQKQEGELHPQLAIARVGEVMNHVIRIVDARCFGGGFSGPAGEDGLAGNGLRAGSPRPLTFGGVSGEIRCSPQGGTLGRDTGQGGSPDGTSGREGLRDAGDGSSRVCGTRPGDGPRGSSASGGTAGGDGLLDAGDGSSRGGSSNGDSLHGGPRGGASDGGTSGGDGLRDAGDSSSCGGGIQFGSGPRDAGIGPSHGDGSGPSGSYGGTSSGDALSRGDSGGGPHGGSVSGEGLRPFGGVSGGALRGGGEGEGREINGILNMASDEIRPLNRGRLDLGGRVVIVNGGGGSSGGYTRGGTEINLNANANGGSLGQTTA